MKRSFKRISALLLVVILVCSLCGCSFIEQLRQSQAFYVDETTLTWNGSTYKLLPACDYLCPNLSYTSEIMLTEQDVPVLLCFFYTTAYLFQSENGAFLIDVEGNYYCIEEKYDQICQRIAEGFTPEIICYRYDLYNENGELETKTYTLTQEQSDALALVLSTVVPVSYNDIQIYPQANYYLDLLQCSSDMIFQAHAAELSADESHFYLTVYTESDVLVFTVPESYNDIFNQIISPYINDNMFAEQTQDYIA